MKKKLIGLVTLLIVFISILFVANSGVRKGNKSFENSKGNNNQISVLVDGVEQNNFPEKDESKYRFFRKFPEEV